MGYLKFAELKQSFISESAQIAPDFFVISYQMTKEGIAFCLENNSFSDIYPNLVFIAINLFKTKACRNISCAQGGKKIF